MAGRRVGTPQSGARPLDRRDHAAAAGSEIVMLTTTVIHRVHPICPRLYSRIDRPTRRPRPGQLHLSRFPTLFGYPGVWVGLAQSVRSRRSIKGGTCTGISSHLGAKLRDWADRQAMAGCFSWAALSSIDSKTRYIIDAS